MAKLNQLAALMNTTTATENVPATLPPKTAATAGDQSEAFDFGRKAGSAIANAAAFLKSLDTFAVDVRDSMIAGYISTILWPDAKATAALRKQAMDVVKMPAATAKCMLKRSDAQEKAYASAKMWFSRALARAEIASLQKTGGTGNTNKGKGHQQKPKETSNTVAGTNTPAVAVTPGFANGQELEAYLMLQVAAMEGTLRKNGKHVRVPVANAVAAFAKAMRAATANH